MSASKRLIEQRRKEKERLADIIRAKWKDLGIDMDVWVERCGGDYEIKSKTLYGAPQGTRRLPLAEGWG